MTCAHVVNVAIKKIPGVESVDVSLNKGSAGVKLKPGNTVRIEQLWDTVRNNGFSAKDTGVVVRGEIVVANGKPRLNVSGLNQSYAIDGFQQYAGRAVTVEGTMTPPKDKKSEAVLRVKTIKGD
ncbi:MAG: heavy-metal-associated domain-containing protein [Acidobacteriota bacterium]|nr:heavy-metal-associated domain-containing protein [Acidobacteriota bacterium]